VNKLLIGLVTKELNELLTGKDEFMYFHRLTGRLFDVRCFEDGSNFVAEYLPTDDNLRNSVKENPNDSLNIFSNSGFDTEDICRMSGGLGRSTIYHDSFQKIILEICGAIENNVIVKNSLTEEERNEKLGEIGLAQEAVTDAENSVSYWFNMANSGAKNSGIFNGTSNMFGPLSKDIKDRVLSFINNPSVETWSECYSIIIAGHNTMWQIWCNYDCEAPRGLSEEGVWPSIPDPKKMIGWIEEMAKDSRIEAIEKLAESKVKLAKAVSELKNLSGSEKDHDASLSF
jgi:hypothetical protein